MTTLAERTLLVLREGSLDDDQIGERLGANRHHVNQVCRRLASAGLVVREVGPRGKIENRLPGGGGAPVRQRAPVRTEGRWTRIQSSSSA
jgi:hypothetical protein